MNTHIDHLGPENMESVDSLGDGNFRARPTGDPDQAGSRGFSRSAVSPLADAWADPDEMQAGFSGRNFKHNAVGLDAEAHEAAVKEFLEKGGEVKKVDQGVQSGLALELRKATIRFGKNPQPFRRDR